jgi:hypothetical protein
MTDFSYCGDCRVVFPTSTFEDGPHAWHMIRAATPEEAKSMEGLRA